MRNLWAEFAERFPKQAYDLNYMRRYHHYDADLWLIPEYCRPSATAVDIGANMGIYSRWMSKHAGQVETFECNPALIPVLAKVLPASARIHRCALSSGSGQAILRFDPNNTGVGTIEAANRLDKNPGIREVAAIEVEIRRLDDFEFEEVSFIKIDVEGHELEVLKGGERLLRRCLPALLLEIEERHCPGNLQAVPDYLRTLGYSSWVIGPSGKLEAAPDLSQHSDRVCNYWFKVVNSV